MKPKINVTFFQRRPSPAFSFSLEFIFDDLRKRLLNEINADVKISKYGNGGLFTKIYNILEAFFRQSKFINHITGETHFLNLLMRKERVVLTILDCGPMIRKQGLSKEFVRWLYLVLPVRKAQIVTTISETTKKDIIKYTGCEPNKIKVIPVAIDTIYKPSPKEFSVEEPKILQIGTGPNKNIIRLVEALNGIKCHLTIIGKLSVEQQNALVLNNINYSNYYGLSQIELINKYKESDIISFVSTFEGFGMPIIEANSIERVVVTSNISSMPEVAADSACLVDPFDIVSISVGIRRVISDTSYRNKLIENGKKNKLRFDVDKIAKLYLKVYEQIDK